MLPPTSTDLLLDETRPYFLWWTDTTVADLRAHLAAPDTQEQAYWLSALLREANTRDVWLFTSPRQIKALWRHLGQSRALWCHLLDLSPPQSHVT